MKALSVSLVLGFFLTLSRAHPLNGTYPAMKGLCEHEQKHKPDYYGDYVPQCDAYGNFLPQQCLGSTGYCWCANVMTGEKVPDTLTEPGTEPVNCGSDHYCPYGWYRFEDQCFIFIDSMKTWAAAECYCLFEGANLASIHSPEKNHFLQSLTTEDTHEFPPTWIGGHDSIYLGYWMWSDGSKFDYENWAIDYKPNITKRCLQMNHGLPKKWINNNCNETLPFICAKAI